MPISKEIIQQLQKNDPNLKNLSLCHELVKTGTISDLFSPGIRALSKILHNNTRLTSLDLEWNGLNDADAEVLADALLENRTLTRLNLKGNRISAVGIRNFLRVIERNTTLINLDMDLSPFSRVGQDLEKFLHRNKQFGFKKSLNRLKANDQTLIELSLLNYSITDEDLKKLAKVLTKNTFLTVLNFSPFAIRATGAVTELVEMLEKNTTITSIKFCGKPIDDFLLHAQKSVGVFTVPLLKGFSIALLTDIATKLKRNNEYIQRMRKETFPVIQINSTVPITIIPQKIAIVRSIPSPISPPMDLNTTPVPSLLTNTPPPPERIHTQSLELDESVPLDRQVVAILNGHASELRHVISDDNEKQQAAAERAQIENYDTLRDYYSSFNAKYFIPGWHAVPSRVRW